MTTHSSEKRVALITGAASGLGASFADCLARRNYDLVLIDRDEDLLRICAEKVTKLHGVQTHLIKQDLTRLDAVENIKAECNRLGLTVDFLVNNAGFHLKTLFLETPLSSIEDNIQILLNVVVETTQQFLPSMMRRRWGRIINVASVSGFMPGGVRLATYNATKTFLIPFSESLNFELQGTGVQVTAVCPGFMRTNLFVNSGLTEVRDSVPGFMWLEAPQVAEEGIRANALDRPVCIAGLINRAIVTVTKLVPRFLLRERTRIFHRSARGKLAANGHLARRERKGRLVALVTGASSGIGASFCNVLADAGYNIILISRRAELLQKRAAELTDRYGIETRVIVQDLTDPQAVEKICAEIQKSGWTIDVLVNNAAYPVTKVFSTMSKSEVSDALQIYIKSVVQLIHALVPGMILKGWGRVINIASLAAFEPGSYQSSLYSSAKAFQVAISESITAELAGTGVAVTAICPGFTHTEWSKGKGLETSSIPAGLWMESEAVARIGFKAALRGSVVCMVGTLPMRMISSLFRLAPRRMIGYILSKTRHRMET